MSPTLYRFATSLLGVVLPLWLRRRVGQGKEDPARVLERFGKPSADRPPGQLVWLHGASVGETQMLRPLIDRLLETPDRTVLLTSGTVTSAELLAAQLPPRAIHQYLPADTPRATARFIAHWRPDLCVLAESELWPNLIRTARRFGAKLALVNARMNPASIAGWRKRPKLAESVFDAFDLILAADRRTADALASIAMRDVPDVGSLKLDAPALGFDADEAEAIRAALGRPAWLAASTHEAEEGAVERIRQQVDAPVIWLPRHPSRGPAIAAATGLPLRSRGEPAGPDGLVMDSLGEMGLALAVSEVCLLGGSLHPSLLGHNPLEAARAGVPLLTGPHHDSFKPLYDAMVESGAVRVVSETDAAAAIRAGLSDELAPMAERARAFAASQSGALDRTVFALEALL